jgi:general secretion pathway protein K
MLYPRSRNRRAMRTQRGAALIVAMLVFALATALVVAMKGEFERFYQRSANILLDEQAQAYLRGAEELAGMALLADFDQDKAKGLQRDDLQEFWAIPPPPYALDEGWMRGTLQDLQGRFNLNSLAERVPPVEGAGAVRFTAAQKQFIRLLQALGPVEVSEQDAILITESVSDWLDADANPSLDGAEDDFYSARTPAHRTPNRAMDSPSELLAVANMTPEIYQALLPLVTVWPRETEGVKINIHTAPVAVLRSINADEELAPLSAAEGEYLESVRNDTGFKDKADFLENQVFDGKRETMTKTMDLLGESTSYFLLQAEAEVAGRNVRLYSVLNRSNRKMSALARATGSL